MASGRGNELRLGPTLSAKRGSRVFADFVGKLVPRAAPIANPYALIQCLARRSSASTVNAATCGPRALKTYLRRPRDRVRQLVLTQSDQSRASRPLLPRMRHHRSPQLDRLILAPDHDLPMAAVLRVVVYHPLTCVIPISPRHLMLLVNWRSCQERFGVSEPAWFHKIRRDAHFR